MADKKLRVERVQTGVRLEKRMVKVLKAIAEYLDISLGDLIEGIVLYALEGKAPPVGEDMLQRIQQIKDIYDTISVKVCIFCTSTIKSS